MTEFYSLGSSDSADAPAGTKPSSASPAKARRIRPPGCASDYKRRQALRLFESGFDRLVDETILVTAPLELRLQRIMQRDGVTRAKAQQWMALQWSDEQRLARADRVICNDGVADLAAQVADLLCG